MFANMDFGIIAAIVVAGIIAHVAMFIIARRINLLFLLSAAYFFVAPLSAAPKLPLVGPLKYVRVYLTVLTVVLGFFVARVYLLRPAGAVFLTFAMMYTCAGLYSELPMAALKYKGLWVVTVLAGLMTGYSVTDSRTFVTRCLRVVMLATAAFTALMILRLVTDPGALNRIGRFMPWDLNPNRLGQTVAPMSIFTTYILLYDRSRLWKLISAGTLFFLAVLILYSGSRGAAGYAVVGCTILGMPVVKRPGLLVTLAIGASIAGFAMFKIFDIGTTERLGTVTLETREEVWNKAWNHFIESPLVGKGWVFQYEASLEGSTANMHSIYFQTAAETGVAGILALLLTLTFIGFRCLRLWRFALSSRYEVPMAHLSLAIIGAVFAHGLFESGSFTGANLGAVVLGIGLALLDRIPELYRNDLAAWEAQQRLLAEAEAESPGAYAPAAGA